MGISRKLSGWPTGGFTCEQQAWSVLIVSDVTYRMTTAVVDFNGVVPEKVGGLGSVSVDVI